MKKYFALAAMLTFLSACSDGIPNVEDPHNPVVDGKPIKGTEFLEKYCRGDNWNGTCDRVQAAVSMDSSKKGLPKGW
jgi:hypothetical protein